MKVNLIVVDDFLDRPDLMRKKALKGNYVRATWRPKRWKGREYVPRNANFSQLLFRFSELIRQRIEEVPINGVFRLVTKKDFHQQLSQPGFVHVDDYDWSAILFLSKSENCRGSFPIFQHKRTGLTEWHPHSEYPLLCRRDGTKLSQWREIATVAFRYNRLVLFNPRQFHGMSPGFGNNKRNGKLFLQFMFNVVKSRKVRR